MQYYPNMSHWWCTKPVWSSVKNTLLQSVTTTNTPSVHETLRRRQSLEAGARCDVARGAEGLVCVLVLRGSCEKKEKGGDVTGLLKFIFSVPPSPPPPPPPPHHGAPGPVRKTPQRRRWKVASIVWLSGTRRESTSCAFQLVGQAKANLCSLVIGGLMLA